MKIYSSYSDLLDPELVAGVLNGDREAFGALVHRHQSAVCGVGITGTEKLTRHGINPVVSILAAVALLFVANCLITVRATSRMRRLGKQLRQEHEAKWSMQYSMDLSRKRYSSSARFLGLPLVALSFGADDTVGENCGVAKGWIAVGDVAWGGFFACGGVAVGPIAVGGVSVGLVSLGGACLGGLAIGGLSVGCVAIGGLAVACRVVVPTWCAGNYPKPAKVEAI